MKILFIGVYLVYCTLSQEIAEKKCREYAKAVYQQETQLHSLRSLQPDAQNISTCAVYDNPLIVGGLPAKAKEFPHMAVIGFGNSEDSDVQWLCGGTLISEQHVLTAAHCSTTQSGPPLIVILGSINIDVNDDYVQKVRVEKSLPHPSYRRPIKYHDIAILFLKNKVKFTAFVRPACLNTIAHISKNKAQATGFGKMSYSQKETSKVLLKVELDILSNEQCNKIMKFREMEMPQKITDKMLCVGRLEGGKDTCQGDSGGPLQVVLEDPYCMYGIIGITSFGRFCGMPNSPGLYTKVDQYIPWIESTIWN